jgi:hypothetical protein
MRCKGCSEVIRKDPNGNRCSAVVCRADKEMANWIDDPDKMAKDHICKPKRKSKVEGLEIRKNLQSRIKEGSNENVPSLMVRLNDMVEIKAKGKSKSRFFNTNLGFNKFNSQKFTRKLVLKLGVVEINKKFTTLLR